MKYNVTQISPLDIKPSIGIGVSIPFSTKSVFQTVYTTAEQIKYNIINFLLTGKRERVFNPTFGSGIQNQVFEVMTQETALGLKQYIQTAVETNFPNITVTSLDIIPDYQNNVLNIKFTYSINNTGQTDEILINFQNG